MMHHAIPRGTALCGATLRPPEVKSCRIIWCVFQREHILENRCDLSASKVCTVIHTEYELLNILLCILQDILHFLNPNTVPKNKINN